MTGNVRSNQTEASALIRGAFFSLGLFFAFCRVSPFAAADEASPTMATQISPSPSSTPSATPGADLNEKVEVGGEAGESEDDQLSSDVDDVQSVATEVHDTGTFWAAPDFAKQTEAVGWTHSTFENPPGFQRRVNFWIDVYTKYTTHQALLHDAHYLDIVYKVLDFSDIDSDDKITPHDKERAKKKRVKRRKSPCPRRSSSSSKACGTPKSDDPGATYNF